MKAMVLYDFSSPMRMTDLEPPQIEPDEVMVRVKACGVCHTDLKIWEGSVPTVKLPRVLGHEVAGEAVEVGERVANMATGDPVVVYPYKTCGNCYFCRISRENYCINLFNLGRLGFERDGGFSEYIKCPSSTVFKFSSKISFEEIAVLPDAIVVPFQAIKKQGKVTAGDDVAVVGLGGIGVHAIQIARACGANVFGITSSPGKLDIAKQFGIENVKCSRESDAAEEVKRATGGKGADVVVDTVGIPATLNQDFKMVRPGGRIVIIGYEYGENSELPIQQVVYNGIEVLGSRGGTKQDVVESLKLVETGRIQPVVSRTFDLAEANIAMEYLKKEKPPGRIVLRP